MNTGIKPDDDNAGENYKCTVMVPGQCGVFHTEDIGIKHSETLILRPPLICDKNLWNRNSFFFETFK